MKTKQSTPSVNELTKYLHEIFTLLMEIEHLEEVPAGNLPQSREISWSTFCLLWEIWKDIAASQVTLSLRIYGKNVQNAVKLQVSQRKLISCEIDPLLQAADWIICYTPSPHSQKEQSWDHVLYQLLFSPKRGLVAPHIHLQGVRQFWRIAENDFCNLISWFFPYSYVGILIRRHDQVLVILLSGGRRPHIRLLSYVDGQSRLTRLTKEYRFLSKIPLVIGIESFFLEQIFQKFPDFTTWRNSYEIGWASSVPLEWDDMLKAGRFLLQSSPWEQFLKASHIERNSLGKLLRNYWQNAKNYFQQDEFFLYLQAHEQAVLFRLHQGLESKPIEKLEKIAPQKLYKIQVEQLLTAISWLNDKSLRLLVHFLETILPEKISAKHLHRETLISMQILKNGKLQQLLVFGSEHILPKSSWGGEQGILSDFSEYTWLHFHNNQPLFVSIQAKEIFVHSPNQQILQPSELRFTLDKQKQIHRGLKKLVGNTAVFSPLLPGLTTTVTMGKLKQPQLQLQDQSYEVLSGEIITFLHEGRNWGYKRAPEYLSHSWLWPEGGGLAFCDHLCSELPKWWQHITQELEREVWEFRQEQSKCSSYHKSNLPLFYNHHKLHPPTSWSSYSFTILAAWIVPVYQSKRFMIRSICKIHKGLQKGFAIVAIPCSLPRILEKKAPKELEMKRDKDTILFLWDDYLVYSIKSKNYMRLAQEESWIWEKTKELLYKVKTRLF